MATPIFSNSVIGEVFDKFFRIYETGEDLVDCSDMVLLHEELIKSIRKYFEERKCIIDKHVAHNICEQCLEDNIIEKDLIGVFVIANK